MHGTRGKNCREQGYLKTLPTSLKQRKSSGRRKEKQAAAISKTRDLRGKVRGRSLTNQRHKPL